MYKWCDVSRETLVIKINLVGGILDLFRKSRKVAYLKAKWLKTR